MNSVFTKAQDKGKKEKSSNLTNCEWSGIKKWCLEKGQTRKLHVNGTNHLKKERLKRRDEQDVQWSSAIAKRDVPRWLLWQKHVQTSKNKERNLFCARVSLSYWSVINFLTEKWTKKRYSVLGDKKAHKPKKSWVSGFLTSTRHMKKE